MRLVYDLPSEDRLSVFGLHLHLRVLLEEARGLSRNLAYHRRARLESRIGETLDEVDRQIVELRATKG